MTLPDGWEATTIGAAARIVTGKTPPTKKSGLYGGDICFFKPGDLSVGGEICASADYITSEGLDYSPLLPPGSVLVTCIGILGKSAITAEPSSCNQQINAVLPSDALEPKFVYYWTRTIGGWLEENASATTVSIINKGRFENAPIAVPPLAEQRRIVAKLDALTARLARARAELDRVPVLAAHLREGALTAARAETAFAPRVPIAELATTTFDGPFGSNLKSADYVPSGVRVVRLENIGHLRFVSEKQTFITPEKYQTLARHTLAPGDILFSSFVDREVRVCQFPDGQEGAAINKADCFAIRTDPQLCDGRFVTYMLASPETYQAMKAKVHGATRPRIGLSHLRDYELHVPPLEMQSAIADGLDAAFARADRLEAEAARARALLDRLEAAILARAFRGELVPQDPTDEPATALLARIRAQRAAAPKAKRGRRAKETADA